MVKSMTRPEKPIDWKKVDQLLMAGCSGTEIAPHFDMHVETFYYKVKEKYNLGFTGYCAIKRDQGDSLLRAKQFEKAMSGDNTLLIWLGKTRLKQREYDITDNPPLDDKIDKENQEMSENNRLRKENAALKEKLDNLTQTRSEL